MSDKLGVATPDKGSRNLNGRWIEQFPCQFDMFAFVFVNSRGSSRCMRHRQDICEIPPSLACSGVDGVVGNHSLSVQSFRVHLQFSINNDNCVSDDIARGGCIVYFGLTGREN